MGIWGNFKAKFQAYFFYFKAKSSKSHSEKKELENFSYSWKKGKEIKRVRRLYPFNFPKKMCINLFTSHHIVVTKGEKKKKRAASVQGGKIHIHVIFF